MVRKGMLNEVERFFIVNNRENMTIDDMAVKLDRTTRIIQKYIDKIVSKAKRDKKKAEQTEIVEGKEKLEESSQVTKPESPIFKLMGRHQKNGKTIATVMTQAASEYADSTRPERLAENHKTKDAIHKPKG